MVREVDEESRISRVIYFLENPLTERDLRRFGIERMKALGFQVEVWDFSPLTHPELSRTSNAAMGGTLEGADVYRNVAEARSAIMNLEPSCFVVNIVDFRYESLFIYRALSTRRVQYGVVANIAMPMTLPRTRRHRLRKVLSWSPSKVVRALCTSIPFRYFGLRPARLIWAAQESALRPNLARGPNSEIVWTHAFDYDFYLEALSEPLEPDSNFGVFLDEYLPHHQDWAGDEMSPPTVPERYYPALRAAFECIESKLGTGIVIAAHPRSQYLEGGWFGGRELVKGNTAGLVRRARFVVAHASQSVGLAVLFKKPVVFLTLREFEEADTISGREYRGWIRLVAGALNKTPILLQHPDDFDASRELRVEEEAYTRYRERYLKRAGSAELPYWDIVAASLRSVSHGDGWSADRDRVPSGLA